MEPGRQQAVRSDKRDGDATLREALRSTHIIVREVRFQSLQRADVYGGSAVAGRALLRPARVRIAAEDG